MVHISSANSPHARSTEPGGINPRNTEVTAHYTFISPRVCAGSKIRRGSILLRDIDAVLARSSNKLLRNSRPRERFRYSVEAMVHKGRRSEDASPWKVDSPDKREIELSGRGMEHARAASLACFVIQRCVTRSPVLSLSVHSS